MANLGRPAVLRLNLLIALAVCIIAFPIPAVGKTYNACDDSAEFPPYAYFQRKKDGPTIEVVGKTINLVRSLLPSDFVSFTLLPWKRCLEEAQEGEIFQIVMNASKTPEREAKFIFTKPIFYLHSQYYYSREKFPNGAPVASVGDLKTHRLCGMLGYDYRESGISSDDIVQGVSRFAQLVNLTLSGRCDFFIEKQEIIDGHALIDSEFAKLVQNPNMAHVPIPGIGAVPYYIMVSRKLTNAQTLINQLNIGIVEYLKP